ncbi:MAG: hypothetical protein M1812_002962 [Candelaria pacifica]|nr:MAG: hypothetical protein M1812_002962 [Candelaria pacifica]
MIDERELAINPIVQESVQHNTRILSSLRSVTASLFGIAAGILGLESWPGFLFYFLGTLIISILVWILRAEGLSQLSNDGSGSENMERSIGKEASGGKGQENRRGQKAKGGKYFQGGLLEIMGFEVLDGLSSFVLTWTLFFGLVRA